MRAGVVAVAVVGLFAVGCGPQKTETSGTPSSTASTSAAAPLSSAKSPGFQPFTPSTDPCSLVAAEQLSAQGAAPIKADPPSESNGIQLCSYEDAGGSEVLGVSLFKNANGAENYRSINVRVLESEGATIYVMKDEADECGVGLVNEDNVAKFVFEPSAAAVAAAALPAEQTWCDFSAPVIAAANKKLGWAK